MKKIFVTGIGGCVGHYLFDLLITNPEYELYLLVRDPAKLIFNPKSYDNVRLIVDDLKNIKKYAGTIKEMDYVIHAAADWAGHEGNLDYSLDLFNLIDPVRCQKVIYFSTASILGKNNQPVPEAETLGTHYVRGKYLLHQQLRKLPIYPKVITLFPTWILGGDKHHPYSHATSGILGIKKWLWLISFFTVDASFHFIHAEDIARIAGYLLENNVKDEELVLGNPAITASQFIRDTCRHFGIPVFFQVPISLPFVILLADLTGHKLHPWDLFCFKKRHFVYKTVNAGTFNLKSDQGTVQGALNGL
jgi:nucleoside-diphosphate-sugar epimerase